MKNEKRPVSDLIPHSLEAEEAVIGSLLVDNDSIVPLSAFLRPDDFFIERHVMIFEVIKGLFEQGKPADLVTIGDELQRRGQQEEVGGLAYLIGLINCTPTAVHAEYYGRIVQREAIKRRMIHAAGQIARWAHETDREPGELLSMAEKLLLDVSSSRVEERIEFVKDLLEDVFNHLERVANKKGLTGIPTGLTDLDVLLGGLQRSDVIIMAARPGMGKTSLALDIAKYAGKHGKKSLVFSLEMSKHQLTQRLIASEAEVPLNLLRNGGMDSNNWAKIIKAQNDIYNLPLAIDDTSSLTPQQLRSKAIRHHARYGLDLVVIDYIQLMGTEKRGENRNQEISEISRAIKNLAKELDIPVIALSQLSRGVESRADKRPMLSDLRDSGSIEQDADIVLFIYQDSVYNPDTDKNGVAELIVSKHRSGPTGTVESYFKKHCVKFVDLSVKVTQFEQIN